MRVPQRAGILDAEAVVAAPPRLFCLPWHAPGPESGFACGVFLPDAAAMAVVESASGEVATNFLL